MRALVIVRPGVARSAAAREPDPFPRIAELLETRGAGIGKAEFLKLPEVEAMRRVSPGAVDSLCDQFRKPAAVERRARSAIFRRTGRSHLGIGVERLDVPALVIGVAQDPLHPLDMALAWARPCQRCNLRAFRSKYESAASTRIGSFAAIFVGFWRARTTMTASPLKASVSLWSADLGNLASEIRRVDSYADLYHLDVSDGTYATLLLVFFPDLVKAIRGVTEKPFEVHLITQRPERWVQAFHTAGANRIIFYPETTENVLRPDRFAKSEEPRRGDFPGVGDPRLDDRGVSRKARCRVRPRHGFRRQVACRTWRKSPMRKSANWSLFASGATCPSRLRPMGQSVVIPCHGCGSAGPISSSRAH